MKYKINKQLNLPIKKEIKEPKIKLGGFHKNENNNKKEKKKKKHGISIRLKIFLYMMLFSIIIIVVLWLCQVVFLDSIYKSIKRTEILSAAKQIENRINSDILKAYSEDIAYRDDMCVMILQMNGNNSAFDVVSIHTQSSCVIHNTYDQAKFVLYDNAKANGGKSLQRFQLDSRLRTYKAVNSDAEFEGTESIVYTLIVKNENKEEFVIILNSIISPVNATVKTLNKLLVIISLFLSVLTAIVATIIARTISKPLVRINNAAKKLAERNYEQNIYEKTYNEISELGETLNYAAREISKVDILYQDLISNVSHDLRTPLTMITGYAEVMRDLPGENTPENIQIIINEANRLTTLVNDLMDIAKFQSGIQKFENKPYNLTLSIEGTVSRYSKMLEKDGYNIVFNYEEKDVFINSDETRILQVLYNLINNAITYAGADKRIIISQKITGDTVRIEVTDNGEGIPEEKLNYVWERYYKVDAFHKRAITGTGLGLFIVQKIIKLAGGKCGVRSMQGWGSTFWFELDILKNHENYIAENNNEDISN